MCSVLRFVVIVFAFFMPMLGMGVGEFLDEQYKPISDRIGIGAILGGWLFLYLIWIALPC